MKSLWQISWLTILLFVVLIGQGFYFVTNGSWSEVFVVFVAVLFSLIPYLLAYSYNLKTTETVRTGIVFFTFCTLVLGEIYKFYDVFWWWDIFLHVVAGAGLAVVMYVWFIILINQSAIKNAPVFYTMFVFCGAATVLVFWEVYEFTIDQLGWSSNPMQPSLHDTMIDLIVGTAGVAVISIGGFIYLIRQHKSLLKSVTKNN